MSNLPPAPTTPAPRLGENLLRRAATLRTRLLVALVLSTPVMVLSMVPAWQFAGWQWVCAALATMVVTWAAWPFHIAALRATRHATSTMDTLVSIGVSAAYLWSMWALIFGGAGALDYTMHMSLLPREHTSHHPHIYFEAATMVTTFLLAGRFAEARARYRAGDALRSLLELGAKTARRVRADGSEEEVPAADLQVGDLVVVRPGEKIPADGMVESGQAALDTALITGESLPVPVSVGSEVTGATINTDGVLQVRLTRVGADTTLAHIGRLVTQAQAGKAPVQRLADRVASVFVPVVLTIAALTLVGWLLAGGGMQAAFTAAVAVLVIACPCALGLATPTALLVGSGRAAQLGIVIKGPEILETTRVVDTAVFDKTGTLTRGQMRVQSVVATPDMDEDGVLALAAAVEASSSHPVARAIVEAAQSVSAEGGAQGAPSDGDEASLAGGHPSAPLSASEARDFTNHAGRGVSATVGTKLVYVGSPTWVAEQGADLSALQAALDDGYRAGATVTVVASTDLPDAGASAAAPADLRDSTNPGSAPIARPGTTREPTSPEPAGYADSTATPSPMSTVPTAASDQAALATQAALAQGETVRIIDLGVTGMTCAACVRRVERKLGKLEGVEASVNLATDSARVTVRGDVSVQQLIDTVEKTGYGATLTGETTQQLPGPESPASSANLGATAGAPADTTQIPGATAQLAASDSPSHTPASTAQPATGTPPDQNPASTAPSSLSAAPAPRTLGCIWVADQVKPDAATALAKLRQMGIKPVLLTGDNAAAADAVAKQLGVDDVHAQVLPAQKQTVIAQLQAQGRSVAMVGDGVNDAAALAQAGQNGLGMAMGSGTDVAIEAADITLMGHSVSAVPTAIALSRRTLRIIKQNLFWAFAYNVAAIPLAVAGLLNPMIAGAAMAMSSVIVVSNSLRLRGWEPS